MSLIVHRKEYKKNSKKPIFYRKPFSKNPVPNIVPRGYIGKIIKKTVLKKFPKKIIFTKNFPEDQISDGTQNKYQETKL